MPAAKDLNADLCREPARAVRARMLAQISRKTAPVSASDCGPWPVFRNGQTVS